MKLQKKTCCRSTSFYREIGKLLKRIARKPKVREFYRFIATRADHRPGRHRCTASTRSPSSATSTTRPSIPDARSLPDARRRKKATGSWSSRRTCATRTRPSNCCACAGWITRSPPPRASSSSSPTSQSTAPTTRHFRTEHRQRHPAPGHPPARRPSQLLALAGLR